MVGFCHGRNVPNHDDDFGWISDHLCVKKVRRSMGCRRHQAQIGSKPGKLNFENLESSILETTKFVWNTKLHEFHFWHYSQQKTTTDSHPMIFQLSIFCEIEKPAASVHWARTWGSRWHRFVEVQTLTDPTPPPAGTRPGTSSWTRPSKGGSPGVEAWWRVWGQRSGRNQLDHCTNSWGNRGPENNHLWPNCLSGW